MDTHLAPGLLVASPTLRCPFFHHTVVLLADHDEDGTFGLVVNRPASTTFREVIEELELGEPDRVEPSVPVLVGGPVSPEMGWVLYDPQSGEAPRASTLELTDRLALSASLDLLRALTRPEGPSRALLALGYAGWGPGQLEREMREGAWLPVDLDVTLLFEVPLEERWRRALASQGIDPARVANHGSA